MYIIIIKLICTNYTRKTHKRGEAGEESNIWKCIFRKYTVVAKEITIASVIWLMLYLASGQRHKQKGNCLICADNTRKTHKRVGKSRRVI